MWQEIVNAFVTMQWYIYVPLIVGVVFLFIECLVPGFGFFGITGLIAIAGAIIANGILTKSVASSLFLVVLFFIVILILFLVFIRSARFGLISKTPFIEKRTAVPKDFADKNKNSYKVLIGQRGVAMTDFTPSGRFMIDDKIYDGITKGESLDKNNVIKVIDVEGNKIIVEKVEV